MLEKRLTIWVTQVLYEEDDFEDDDEDKEEEEHTEDGKEGRIEKLSLSLSLSFDSIYVYIFKSILSIRDALQKMRLFFLRLCDDDW